MSGVFKYKQDYIDFHLQRYTKSHLKIASKYFWSALSLPLKSLSLAPSPKSCLLTPSNIPKCLDPPFWVEFPTSRSRSAITQYLESRAATIITNATKAKTAAATAVPRLLKILLDIFTKRRENGLENLQIYLAIVGLFASGRHNRFVWMVC